MSSFYGNSGDGFGEISIVSNSEEYAKIYTIKQGNKTIGTIDIPKDMVVSDGQIVTNPIGEEEGTYIELTLANSKKSPIYINVKSLVDTYVASKEPSAVKLTIEDHIIKAEIEEKSITTQMLKEETIKNIKDETIEDFKKTFKIYVDTEEEGVLVIEYPE